MEEEFKSVGILITSFIVKSFLTFLSLTVLIFSSFDSCKSNSVLLLLLSNATLSSTSLASFSTTSFSFLFVFFSFCLRSFSSEDF